MPFPAFIIHAKFWYPMVFILRMFLFKMPLVDACSNFSCSIYWSGTKCLSTHDFLMKFQA